MIIATVEVKPAKFGKGVFAKQILKKDETVGIVQGKVYNAKEAPESSWEYLIDLHRAKKVVNPNTPFRYLNHCCTPNCRLSSNGEKVSVITMKKIKEGEELTIDYNWPADCAIRCGCNSKKCRGYIVAEHLLHKVKKG